MSRRKGRGGRSKDAGLRLPPKDGSSKSVPGVGTPTHEHGPPEPTLPGTVVDPSLDDEGQVTLITSPPPEGLPTPQPSPDDPPSPSAPAPESESKSAQPALDLGDATPKPDPPPAEPESSPAPASAGPEPAPQPSPESAASDLKPEPVVPEATEPVVEPDVAVPEPPVAEAREPESSPESVAAGPDLEPSLEPAVVAAEPESSPTPASAEPEPQPSPESAATDPQPEPVAPEATEPVVEPDVAVPEPPVPEANEPAAEPEPAPESSPVVPEANERAAEPESSPVVPEASEPAAEPEPAAAEPEPAAAEPEPAAGEPEPDPEPAAPPAAGGNGRSSDPIADPVAALATEVADSAPTDDGVAERDPVVAGALRAMVVPDHDPHFWDGVAEQLADEPQLRLRPRAAVRPITQPPPVIDDRLPFDDGDLRPRGRMAGRRRRRRVVVWVVAIVLSALIIGTALDRDDGADEVRSDRASTTTTEPAAAPGQGSAPGSSDPPPAAPVAPDAALTPDGVGPLAIGASMRDLLNSGTPAIEVVQRTFDGSGGTCFDATVADVGDLTLRFRSPQPGQGVGDPADGLLGAIHARQPTFRTTEAGVPLGATEDQVRAAYPEHLTETPHPFTPGGHVLTHVPPDRGNGIAFMTDGAVVTSIAVGAADLIGYPEGCP